MFRFYYKIFVWINSNKSNNLHKCSSSNNHKTILSAHLSESFWGKINKIAKRNLNPYWRPEWNLPHTQQKRKDWARNRISNQSPESESPPKDVAKNQGGYLCTWACATLVGVCVLVSRMKIYSFDKKEAFLEGEFHRGRIKWLKRWFSTGSIWVGNKFKIGFPFCVSVCLTHKFIFKVVSK